MPAEQRDRIFQPFQRLGDTDNTTGLGLGLAAGGLGYGYGGGYGYGYDDGYYGNGYAPAAYGYEQEGYAEPEVVQPQRSVSYCVARFRSYDRRSGTYLGNDGARHACP